MVSLTKEWGSEPPTTVKSLGSKWAPTSDEPTKLYCGRWEVKLGGVMTESHCGKINQILRHWIAAELVNVIVSNLWLKYSDVWISHLICTSDKFQVLCLDETTHRRRTGTTMRSCGNNLCPLRLVAEVLSVQNAWLKRCASASRFAVDL